MKLKNLDTLKKLAVLVFLLIPLPNGKIFIINGIAIMFQFFNLYGTPEIINSDQGSQFTSEQWVSCLKEHQIKISMDGKGRATDNAFIERFFRNIKYDYIYLNPAGLGIELYQGIKKYVKKYNNRKHQELKDKSQ